MPFLSSTIRIAKKFVAANLDFGIKFCKSSKQLTEVHLQNIYPQNRGLHFIRRTFVPQRIDDKNPSVASYLTGPIQKAGGSATRPNTDRPAASPHGRKTGREREVSLSVHKNGPPAKHQDTARTSPFGLQSPHLHGAVKVQNPRLRPESQNK